MKKMLSIVIGLGISLLVLLTIFVFVLQLKSNMVLNRELNEKKAALQDAKTASRKMDNLERKIQELRQKDNKIKRRVVVGDVRPLDLIKKIAGSASNKGLRKISFELKTGSTIVAKDKTSAVLAKWPGGDKSNFEMKFEASFRQVLEFLEELNGFERVITVERIEIIRKPEILPYQSVVLALATYSFAE